MIMMVTYEVEKLKYSTVFIDVTCRHVDSENILKTYNGVDCLYRNVKVRGKLIYRLDVMMHLKGFLCEETIKEYRDAIYMLISGQVDDTTFIADCIKELINCDIKFANYLSELYYLSDSEEPFGYTIFYTLSKMIAGKFIYYKELFKSKPQFVICLSDGWLYFASPKDISFDTKIGDIECEVVSC